MRFDSLSAKRCLGALSSFKRLAFALLLCQRSWPAFEKFGSDTSFDVYLYRKALKEGWSHLGGGPRPPAEYAVLAQQCLAGRPDPDNFNHPLKCAALEAGFSIGLMMEFLADGDVDHIVGVAKSTHTIAYMFEGTLEYVAPHSLTSWTGGLELVQRELGQQANDLAFLESLPSDSPGQMVPLIRERAARTPDMIPIGVVWRPEVLTELGLPAPTKRDGFG